MLDPLINQLVHRFQSGESTGALLGEINRDSDDLYEWACRREVLEHFVFLLPVKDLPVPAEEDVYDYYDSIYVSSDQEIAEFMRSRVAASVDDSLSLHTETIQNACIAFIVEIRGQAGPHLDQLGIYRNEAECFEVFKESGWLLTDGQSVLSHSDDELVTLFKSRVK